MNGKYSQQSKKFRTAFGCDEIYTVRWNIREDVIRSNRSDIRMDHMDRWMIGRVCVDTTFDILNSDDGIKSGCT